MVIWAPRARKDLKAIHDYIAEDSPMNARQVVDDITAKVVPLEALPTLGKVVPEVRDPALREVSAHTWRILYHIRQDQVYIVTIVHKRRRLEAGDVRYS